MVWFWRRFRRAARIQQDEEEDWSAFGRRAVSEGFRLWLYSPPATGTLIECRRREWPSDRVWLETGADPWLNIAGLWWRPCVVVERVPGDTKITTELDETE